ncbi:MAG: HAD-IC family P-type ATPase [Acholeplasmatales bacterium]|nr:HAD-IC family P-type ATPase [Acholeplasmatales bacterium]
MSKKRKQDSEVVVEENSGINLSLEETPTMENINEDAKTLDESSAISVVEEKETLENKEGIVLDEKPSDDTKELHDQFTDPKYLDKTGKPLSAKKIAKIKAREAREEARQRQLELEKKINEANRLEARKREAIDQEERDKERNALRAQKIAKKLARKRQTNMQYVERFNVNPEDGLSDEQVNQRILEGFSNFKPKSSSKSIPQILFQNIFTFFNILTITIAGFLISVGAIKDCIFLLIITANIVIGIIQEIRAKSMIDQLSLISAPTVNVIRNGKISEISVGEVVLDDIMLLEAGKQICTDSVVADGTIEVNESLLTGESDSIVKKPGDILYSGSYVVAGVCKARVEKVGKDNYIEALTTSAKKYMKPKSELLHSLNIIIYVMAAIIIPIGVGLFLIQYMKNSMPYSESIRKTAGAMIGMIPSGLYLCTSMALAVGVMRLAKKNVLVQELYCIEMLARIDVLCLDKTGTITDGSMVVKDVVEYKNCAGLNTKYAISAWLNALNDRNLTSEALEAHFGSSKMLKCTGTIPFSSKRKFSAATFDKYGTFIVGAPEFILHDKYHTISKDVDKFAKDGYRVLLLAYTEGSISNQELPDTNIEAMSLILIEDNIRPDAIETIKYFRESGVEVKVISGDNPITVGKIAQRAGIENAENYISLDGLSEQEVVRAASKYTVFGRVSPSQKRLLVKTLKELGRTVAMTGDGVNDILALKEADCSIAMASGSEAARNVSHLVLLDSNFGSMPSVVAEGRRVINNITKVARLYLTKTMFSLMLAIIALLKGYYPISTNQLFMIDMFCIGIPSIVLVLEKNNDLNKGHFLGNVLKSALPGAIVIVIQSLIVFLLENDFTMSTTATSTIIVLAATFTCEMVLYDVCTKPVFTSVHKVLFYSMFVLFVFVALLTPRFFDFAPLGSVGTYYSDNVENYSWRTPEVAVSKANTYAINGKVIYKNNVAADQFKYYTAAVIQNTHTVSVNDNGSLLIDGTTVIAIKDYDYTKELPSLYRTSKIDGKHYYALGGYETNLDYDLTETKKLEVNENGEVLYDEVDTGYNILPTVKITSDGYYSVLVNGKEIVTETKGSGAVGKVTIDEQFHVLVDGVVLEEKNTKVPFVLYNDGIVYGENNEHKLVINMSNTHVEFDDVNLYNVSLTVNGKTYYINSSDTKIDFAPEISLTKANYYIVDGYITDYECKTNSGMITSSVSSDGYLQLGDTKTNIKVDLYKSMGGNVENLPMNCLILLFMLCLLTMPLMKIINGFVPFVKKWIHIILDKINKL